MAGKRETTAPRTKTLALTVRVPEDLMEKIKIFCTNNALSIEQYAVDALSEKLSRWKE